MVSHFKWIPLPFCKSWNIRIKNKTEEINYKTSAVIQLDDNTGLDQGVSSECYENWSRSLNGIEMICDQKHRLMDDFKIFWLSIRIEFLFIKKE